MALNKGRQFEILRELLAEVDERGSVSLDDAGERYDLSREVLYAMIEPLLNLEFFPPDGANPVSWLHQLEFDGDLLTRGYAASGGVPVRDLETQPPDQETALDLYLSAAIMNSLEPSATLAAAVERLSEVVHVTFVVPFEQPPALGVVQQAWNERRSVVTKYLAEGADTGVEKEILPWRIFANWGRWYVKGTSTEHGQERTYRIDRMLDARLGDTAVDRPDHQPIPEWFDLDRTRVSLRVRMPADVRRSLTGPIEFSDEAPAAGSPDGWIDVTVAVHGDARLDHLLVSLPPAAEVLEPAELAQRRREHAARLLADYV